MFGINYKLAGDDCPLEKEDEKMPMNEKVKVRQIQKCIQAHTRRKIKEKWYMYKCLYCKIQNTKKKINENSTHNSSAMTGTTYAK